MMNFPCPVPFSTIPSFNGFVPSFGMNGCCPSPMNGFQNCYGMPFNAFSTPFNTFPQGSFVSPINSFYGVSTPFFSNGFVPSPMNSVPSFTPWNGWTPSFNAFGWNTPSYGVNTGWNTPTNGFVPGAPGYIPGAFSNHSPLSNATPWSNISNPTGGYANTINPTGNIHGSTVNGCAIPFSNGYSPFANSVCAA